MVARKRFAHDHDHCFGRIFRDAVWVWREVSCAVFDGFFHACIMKCIGYIRAVKIQKIDRVRMPTDEDKYNHKCQATEEYVFVLSNCGTMRLFDFANQHNGNECI